MERAAVIGIGQTKYRRKRDLSIDGLVREAALRALEDAELDFSDIEAVVIGKAKLDSYGVRSSLRTWEMPCVASLHQLYAFSPSDGMAGLSVSRDAIFSASVMRDSMSATLTPTGSVWLHQGCAA